MKGDFLPASAMPDRLELVLLQEMSHRVLNEFAGALAILQRAERRCVDESARSALSRAGEHMQAFADVHRALSPQTALSSREGNCLEAVCRAMSQARLREAGIALKLSYDAIPLDPPRRWRLNLIVSELITNAARHAFDDEGGRVQVSVADFGNMVVCRVDDDGRGINEEPAGTGTNIIQALVADIQGKLTLARTSTGTSAMVSFPRHRTSPC